MELIIVSNHQNRTFRLPIGLLGVSLTGLLFLASLSGTFHIGSKIALSQAEISYSKWEAQKKSHWRHALENQQANIDAAKKNAETNLDALSARLSILQAHLLRLDALGSRLIDIAGMSEKEFNMLEPPGLGGPLIMTKQTSMGMFDFIETLQDVSQKIEDRSEKFSAMESMLLNSNVQSQILPEGSPVTGGWASSAFGWRTDPILGKKDFHRGVDFAGRSGSNILSVATGIVIWSGKHYGYGNVIDVSHGNGYVTRYAHNKKNLVVVGDKVEKGQKIALMGSSGRSTGPHLHFEVVHNGKHVNPKKFVPIN